MLMMASLEFTQIPTEDEIVAAAHQITPRVAGQILQTTRAWIGRDEQRQIQLLNYLCNEIEQQGEDHWEDLRWSVLVGRINQLSTQINDMVANF